MVNVILVPVRAWAALARPAKLKTEDNGLATDWLESAT